MAQAIGDYTRDGAAAPESWQYGGSQSAPSDALLLAAIDEHQRLVRVLRTRSRDSVLAAPRDLLAECGRQLELVILLPASTVAGHAARARIFAAGSRDNQAEIAADPHRDYDQRVLAALLRDLVGSAPA